MKRFLFTLAAALLCGISLAQSTGDWTLLKGENQSFKLTVDGTVRFGREGKGWVVQVVKGGWWTPCSRQTFGVKPYGTIPDPAPGLGKVCQLAIKPLIDPVVLVPPPDVTVPQPPINDMPVTGVGTPLPLGTTGYSTGSSVVRIGSTNELPGNSDGSGAFRTVCTATHMAYDDPIVFPGQPGKSHLHVFFGNTGVNAFSTPQSIATSGNSSCRGGIANRSAYWVPALVDIRTNVAIMPMGPEGGSHFYYKSGYGVWGLHAQVKPFPTGLRMIAGDPKRTEAAPTWGAAYGFLCARKDGVANEPVTRLDECTGAGEIRMTVDFPQCWDGKNLDSPDHKSHMAYPSGGRCPTTHPVIGPHISFNIVYTNLPPLQYLRLSSDPAGAPAGVSMHGDWVNGWQAPVMNTWVTRCLNTAKDCHSHLLGDGRTIF